MWRWCWSLVAALGPAACTNEGTFTCGEDSQCVAGEAVGQCEPNGHCSFFDPECPSERRYGQAAPAPLAGACVPLEDASSGSSGMATTTTPTTPTSTGIDESSTGDPTLSSTTGSDSTTQPGTSTTDPSSTGEPSGSETSTGGTGCPTLLDEFDAGVLDKFWFVYSDGTANLLDGEVRIPVTAPAGDYVGIGSELFLDLEQGSITVELGSTPTQDGFQQLFLIANTDEQWISFTVLESGLELRQSNQGAISGFVTHAAVDFESIDEHRWLRFRKEPDATVMVAETSANGVGFSTLFEVPIEPDWLQWRIDLTATDWLDLPEGLEVSFRSFDYCDPSK